MFTEMLNAAVKYTRTWHQATILHFYVKQSTTKLVSSLFKSIKWEKKEVVKTTRECFVHAEELGYCIKCKI